MNEQYKKYKPPYLAKLLLRIFLGKTNIHRLYEYDEIFQHIYREEGGLTAWKWYWSHTIRSVPKLILNKIYWGLSMIRNYLITAVRNIRKNKIFSFINLFGLSTGLAGAIIIFLFITHEMNYDNFHAKGDRIYRVVSLREEDPFVSTPSPLGPALEQEFSEIEKVVRVCPTFGSSVPIKCNNKKYYEARFLLGSKEFFSVFGFKLLIGNPNTVLEKPNSVVLTEATAQKYFGNENPIGKTINYRDRLDLEVTGIAENLPENTHLHFDLLAPYESMQLLYKTNFDEMWGASNFMTYILLSPSTSAENLEAKLPTLFDKYKQKKRDYFERMTLQPINGLHFDTARGNLEPTISKEYIYIFSLVGFVLLIIACINFMNLSTAKSIKRIKEVGMRKVIGASKKQLIIQFLGESFLLTILALIFAVIIVSSALPYINSLIDKNLTFDLSNTSIVLMIIGMTLFTGFMSGVYPAFYISSFTPFDIFKKSYSDKRGGIFKNILVILQFSAAIILIIASLVVYQQNEYVKNKNLGWNKSQLLTIPLAEKTIKRNVELLKEKCLTNPNVISASGSQFLPSNVHIKHGMWWEGQGDRDQLSMWVFFVDTDFFKTFQIDFAEGRGFSDKIESDKGSAYVINEAAAAAFGWDNPIGKQIDAFFQGERGSIIGVAKNFNFRSLHFPIEPCVFYYNPGSLNQLTLRVRKDNMQSTLAFVKNSWNEITNKAPFSYFFMEDDVDNLYSSEIMLAELIKYFTIFALLIACLGLLGLASYSAERKVKEIGIRKVLGSSVTSIVMLLTSRFIGWILLANIIAWPVAYFFMDGWLNDFAYRIDIGIWTFILAGFTALLIALLTVSYQAIKAANANPVESLKHE